MPADPNAGMSGSGGMGMGMDMMQNQMKMMQQMMQNEMKMMQQMMGNEMKMMGMGGSSSPAQINLDTANPSDPNAGSGSMGGMSGGMMHM